MPHARRSPDARGFLLVTVILLTAVLAVLAGGLFMFGLARSRASGVELDGIKAYTLAEGGLDLAAREILDAMVHYALPPTEGQLTVNGETLYYTIEPVGSPSVSVDAQGWSGIDQQYRIRCQSTTNGVPSILESHVTLSILSPFQMMAYAEGDLVLQPGQAMTLEGGFHANGDLYIGGNHALVITDTPYLRSAGRVWRSKPDGSPTSGLLEVAGAEWPAALDSQASDWLAGTASRWGNCVQDGSHHGALPFSSPSQSVLAVDGFYHRLAEAGGLVVLDNQVYEGGVNITGLLPAGTVSEATVYDAREGRTVVNTVIDVAKLNASGHFPENRMIYASRSDSSPSQPNGIQLCHGSLLWCEMTTASDCPVWIQGDYNTVQSKPSAVVADSVNLLSNAWNGTKAPGSLPAAADTTYKVCVAAGTSAGDTFTSLARLHEDWSGHTCRIRGSLAALWGSSRATAGWAVGGDVYAEPIFDLQFPSELLNPAVLQLLPGSPVVGRLSRISFKEVKDEGVVAVPLEETQEHEAVLPEAEASPALSDPLLSPGAS